MRKKIRPVWLWLLFLTLFLGLIFQVFLLRPRKQEEPACTFPVHAMDDLADASYMEKCRTDPSMASTNEDHDLYPCS